MKLKSVHVTEYKSIWDSTNFDVGQITCLVGKNESGKTALLEALYRLNPIIEIEGSFDVTSDYPRMDVEDYQQDLASGKRVPASIIRATFSIDADVLKAIAESLGDRVLKDPLVRLTKGYDNVRHVSLPLDEPSAIKHLVQAYGLTGSSTQGVDSCSDLKDLSKLLEEKAHSQAQAYAEAQRKANEIPNETAKAEALNNAKSLAEPDESKRLREHLKKTNVAGGLEQYIWKTFLESRLPKFLYFDEYYQMRGHDNIQALIKRQKDGKLQRSDHPLLGLIELARIQLDKILDSKRTEELTNKLQGASNHLTKQILKYWSQNRHLRMNFDVRQALAGDPEGMREGWNVWGGVYDSKHLVTTNLGTRSRGFVWFFSFLAWYSALKAKNQPLILLLDEPGLSLHGKAQEDLLKYFEAEIFPNASHQLLYTTHSPFMVDPRNFDRVRIVQDKGIDTEEHLPRDQDGTKVLTEVLEAGEDSLFPLQGALGYEIYQTLFIGPNCLVVEGVSDLLYLQTLSSILEEDGRAGIDPAWTITPVGGSEKIPTFVALVGAQKGLNVVTLIDLQKKDQQAVENLYKRKLLTKSHVLTFADFVGNAEADIEDMFDVGFYLRLLNEEFKDALPKKITQGMLKSKGL